MNIKVATLCSFVCRDIGKVTEPITREYCARHGYTFETKKHWFKQFSLRCGTHHFLAFERWRWFAEVLETCDMLFAIGSDVLITNHTTKLEDIAQERRSFICAKDAQGFNSDVLLVRNNPATLTLMRHVASLQSEFAKAPDNILDQGAFDSIAPNYTNEIHYVPQRLVNAYEYKHYAHLGGRYAQALDAEGNDGQWQRGDFVLHVPGLPKQQKIQILKEHLPLIVR